MKPAWLRACGSPLAWATVVSLFLVPPDNDRYRDRYTHLIPGTRPGRQRKSMRWSPEAPERAPGINLVSNEVSSWDLPSAPNL